MLKSPRYGGFDVRFKAFKKNHAPYYPKGCLKRALKGYQGQEIKAICRNHEEVGEV